MKDLSREDIKSARDVEVVRVEVPEWGGAIYISPLTVNGREKLMPEYEKVSEDDTAGIKMLLFVATAQDKNGKQLFTYADIPWLREKRATAIDKAFEIAESKAAVTDKSLKN